MPAAKLMADLITWSRAAIALLLGGLWLVQPEDSLPLAVILMILDWTGDYLDGQFARLGPRGQHSWIGDHDLHVDMLVSGGLLVYLLGTGRVAPWLAGVYLLAWALAFWRLGVPRSMGMLFQAPIYAWFIWLAITLTPVYGSLIIAWILAVVIFTWPRFLNEVVPGFLAGMNAIRSKR